MKAEYIMLSVAEQSILEKAFSNAIQSTIVTPFKQWLLNSWITFANASYWICLFVATIGVISAICVLSMEIKVSN